MELGDLNLGQSFELPDQSLKYMLTERVFNWCLVNADPGEVLNVANCVSQRIYQDIKMGIRLLCGENGT